MGRLRRRNVGGAQRFAVQTHFFAVIMHLFQKAPAAAAPTPRRRNAGLTQPAAKYFTTINQADK
ncbi:hypothetical protein HCH_05763 [Hahella chejuensis KCTC 2396]|uniref:Uncharacterized protein n=1 Tax=Hahella chejuensis (strain KCTC 2396) TaxID=349521 RepID=Q2SAB0_HAHCH|nr:hypothetical protein [Hahella chejuensis]ABC32414.1 hypothetical protein HCH_05763 [Hahella chejuensis KCTC 2396]